MPKPSMDVGANLGVGGVKPPTGGVDMAGLLRGGGGGGGGWGGDPMEPMQKSLDPVSGGVGVAPPMQQAQGGAGVDAPPKPPMQLAPTNNYGNAISAIESGGRYDLKGPVTRNGDRAYGKYQVMGNNIGPWSEAAIGRRVTPQEFLANPEIQDKVFQNQFGQYVSKYGPEGAARAWFAGEGGMNDLGRRDQLGTSVGSYGQRFAAGLGRQQPQDAPQAIALAAPQEGQPATAAAPQANRQVAQAQNAQEVAMIEQMLNHPNKRVRDMGAQMMQKQMLKGPEDKVVGDYYLRTMADGSVRVLFDATKKTETEKERDSENADRRRRNLPELSTAEWEQEKKKRTTQGTQQGEALAGLPQAENNVQQAVAVLDQLRTHPGRSTGPLAAMWAAMPNAAVGVTPQFHEFKLLFDQAKGKALQAAYDSIRGAGQITEKETTWAGQAMDLASSKEAFERAMNDFESAIRAGYTKMQQRARGEANTTGPVSAPGRAQQGVMSVQEWWGRN
jgi:hypothetical protein